MQRKSCFLTSVKAAAAELSPQWGTGSLCQVQASISKVVAVGWTMEAKLSLKLLHRESLTQTQGWALLLWQSVNKSPIFLRHHYPCPYQLHNY